MKKLSYQRIGLLVLALSVLGLFSAAPAFCQAGGHALLLQQTPSQGGIVSPEVGVHHFGSEVEITLIAIPKPGYNFIYWLGDVLDPTASKTTAILDEPKIIVAVFQQIEEGQIVVGQNIVRTIAGGGGGSFKSRMGSAGGGGPGPGRTSTTQSPSTPGETGDNNPPDDPPGPPDNNPDPDPDPDPPELPPVINPPVDPFDPPDPPIDPPDPTDPTDPIDPPDVPEPATCLMLSLGALALLRKRKTS